MNVQLVSDEDSLTVRSVAKIFKNSICSELLREENLNIKSVSTFILETSNWNKMVAFYSTLLGMRFRLVDSGDLTVGYEVDLGNCCMAIHPLSDFSKAKLSSTNIKISVEVDWLSECVSKLENNGFKAVYKLDDGFLRSAALFVDPDGNTIELFESRSGCV